MANMDTLSMMTGMPKGAMRRGRHVGKKTGEERGESAAHEALEDEPAEHAGKGSVNATAGGSVMKKGTATAEQHHAALQKAMSGKDHKAAKSHALKLVNALHRSSQKAMGAGGPGA